MNNIVLKDKEGNKKTYSAVDSVKLTNDSGAYVNYIEEPTAQIAISENGVVDVKKYATAKVDVVPNIPESEGVRF